MTQFDDTASAIEAASDYLKLFGPVPANCAPTTHVSQSYRKMVRLIHPDYFRGTRQLARAEEVFKKLAGFYEEAEVAAKRGTYGQLNFVEWRTRRAKHRVVNSLGSGDLCATYAAMSVNAQTGNECASFCKVAKGPADRDLLVTEATALKRLRSTLPTGPDDLRVFFPQLLDSFVHREHRKPDRHVNVLPLLEGFYTLGQVAEAYGARLQGVHMAWIWRRILWALGHAHQQGIVHGAILPEHIMVLPQQHGVLIVDWCYASIVDDGGTQPPLKAIVGAYKDWYPAEVFAKAAPGPATDIAMAARCMIKVTGGDPVSGNYPSHAALIKPFRAFLRGCIGSHPASRPQDALHLLGEFDELLKGLGKPYYPRKFRTFHMPPTAA